MQTREGHNGQQAAIATRPAYRLPAGWTWRRVVAERGRWDISERFYPVASVAGVATAWGRPLNCVVEE